MAKPEIDDRFKRFGTVSFTATSKVNDFIGHLEKGSVMGTRCNRCSLSFFPPRADCYNCLGQELDWFDITQSTGTLLTFTTMKYGPVGFEDDLPYTIAVVDFGNFKMFGRISGRIPAESIAVGMAMKAEANTLDGGQMNFVFRQAVTE